MDGAPSRIMTTKVIAATNIQMRTEVAKPANGFALLIVLGWLSVLFLLMTQMIANTRMAVAISSNIRSSAMLEAVADGAVNEAIFQTLTLGWTADGTPHIHRWPQAVTEVRVEDEGGRIDPNVAPAALIQALLRECGASPKAAANLADAIAEWRSLDTLQTDRATKNARYRTAGLGYVPPNARFVSVDELGLVLGMTPDLVACLEPHVSVYALSVPSVQTTSDPLVRQALASAYPYETVQPVAATVREVAVIRITATAVGPGGIRFRRTAVVRVVPAEPEEHFTYKILSQEGTVN